LRQGCPSARTSHVKLQLRRRIQRIYAGDIAPNDQYFVVGSGSATDGWGRAASTTRQVTVSAT